MNMTKNKFHRQARALLVHIATDHLHLSSPQDFDVRTNFGGPAVLGETILHTNNIYVQIGGLSPNKVLVRSCMGRKDYTGGHNHFVPLDKKQVLIDTIRKLSQSPVENDWSLRRAL